MPKNWNRRFKHNRDKIKTGDIFELAEVVRNLSIRDLDKGLSTGEKQMFGRAKKILASELMYARDMEEQEAIDFLENLLEDIGQRRGPRRRRAPGRRGARGLGAAGPVSREREERRGPRTTGEREMTRRSPRGGR